MLTLNGCTSSFRVVIVIVNIEQGSFTVDFNACWDDNDNHNDDNRYDEDVEKSDFQK